MVGEIDQAAVAQFVAGAEGATAAQVQQVVARLDSMIQRGERAKLGATFASVATMQAARDALAARLDG